MGNPVKEMLGEIVVVEGVLAKRVVGTMEVSR